MVVRGGGQLDPAGDRKLKSDQNRRQQLLQKCSSITVDYFRQFVSPAAEAVSENLFDSADQAESTQQQNDYLNQRDQMLKQQSRFSELMCEAVADNFSALINPQQTTIEEPEPEKPGNRSELKLIDDEDLEEKLIMLGMVSKVELRQAQEIYSLNERFSVLNHGGKRIKDDNNPCGPLKLGEAIQRSMDQISDEAFPKAELFKELDLIIQTEIGHCYHDINAYLIDEDILPNLEPSPHFKASRSGRQEPDAAEAEELAKLAEEAEQTEQGTDPGEQAQQVPPHPMRRATDGPVIPQRRSTDSTQQQAASAPARQIPNDPAQNKNLISNIRDLISQRYQQQGGAAGQSSVPHAKLQNALSSLQSNAARVGSESSQPSIADLKASLGKLLTKDGESYALSESHSQTFDIFEMLYQFVEQETMLHRKVENLLTQLQVPMLRVALQDEEFFNNTEHPARQLFNTIAEAGELWLGDTPEDSKTFGKMQTATEHVLNEFNDDVGVFRDLIDDLDKHIKLLSRKAQISEKRHVETLQGQERLELARKQAQQVVDQLIEKHNPPLFIKSVLQKPWADYLGLILLRHGDKSEIWNTAIGVANMLIISVQEDLHDSVKSSINNRREWLYTELNRGLSQVGYYENDIKDVMANLQACHRWSLAKTAEDSEAPETAVSEPLPEEVESAEEAVAESASPATAEARAQPAEHEAEDLSEQALNEAVTEAKADSEKLEEQEARSESKTKPDPSVVYERFEPDPQQKPPEKPDLLDNAELLPKALKVKARIAEPILKTSSRSLTSDQTTMLNRLRKLEFGTWFEILFKDTTEWVKRKLAWYSPVTDRCMLVNNRGASCEQITMHDLAEYMADKKARIFTPKKKPLMDRALEGIFRQLKKLSTLTTD